MLNSSNLEINKTILERNMINQHHYWFLFSDLSVKIWNLENLTCYKTLNGLECGVSFIKFFLDFIFLFFLL